MSQGCLPVSLEHALVCGWPEFGVFIIINTQIHKHTLIFMPQTLQKWSQVWKSHYIWKWKAGWGEKSLSMNKSLTFFSFSLPLTACFCGNMYVYYSSLIYFPSTRAVCECFIDTLLITSLRHRHTSAWLILRHLWQCWTFALLNPLFFIHTLSSLSDLSAIPSPDLSHH